MNQRMIMIREDLLADFFEKLEALGDDIQAIRDNLENKAEVFPHKMTLTQVAKSLGKSYRTVISYTEPGGVLPKYYDTQGQPYCKGEEVRKFKYGL